MFMLAVPMLEAEQVLREKGGELTAESLLAVMKQAGRSDDEAESAYCRRVLEESRMMGG
jgi:hypothetical protein